MAYQLFLERYNNDFSKQLPITLEEWKDIANQISELSYKEYEKSLEAYFEEFDEKYPIFWFSTSTNIHMNGRVMSPKWYEFAVKIAEHFKALIIGEEGEIIYLPTYGGIYDNFDFITIDTWNLKLEQITDNNIIFDEDFSNNINEIIRNQK